MTAWPELTGERLLGKIRALGYAGGRTAVSDFLRTVRSPPASIFEVRLETPPGEQAQVDFAVFKVCFGNQGPVRRVWLFAMVLGHSRYRWGQFVLHQDLPTVLRCHMEAFVGLAPIFPYHRY